MSRNARSRMGRAIKAAPSFSLDFTKGVLDPRLTFTRASGATFVGSDGLLQTAASGVPRFDYDPVTLAIRGLLIEGTQTNLCVTSSGYVTGNTTETAVDAVTRAANRTGIDGVTNSESTYTEGVGTATHGLFLTSPIAYTSGTTYTTSVVFTALGATRVQMTFGSAAFGAAQYANFGLTGAGSVLASAGCAATIVPLGNSRYRCSTAALATATTGGPPTIVAFINSDTATRLPSYTGSGTLTLGVFGMQTEAGAFPTSIIPTSGAAATRVGETVYVLNRPWPWFNPSQGSVVIDWLLGPDGADLRLAAFDDGSNTNRIVFQRSTGNIWTGFGAGFGAGWSLVNVGGGVSGQGTRCVIAGTYDVLSVSSSAKNGGVASSAASRMASPATSAVRFSVGNNNGGSQINGHLRAVDYYPVALDPQTLRRITSATENPSPRRINPDFSLHFLDGVLDSRVTFTRASSGTRINSAGVLVLETTNAPRFDYDPITLACKGLLIEEARTNLSLTSRAHSVGTGPALAQNAVGSDGAANAAWTVTEDTGAAGHFITNNSTPSFVSGTTYTLTALIKPGTATKCQLTGPGAAFGATQCINLNLSGAGSVLQSLGGAVGAIKPGPNGFYTCSITIAATASATGVPVAISFINTDTDARLPSYTGTSRTLIVDHCQAEVGSFATSIIPTTGAAATRAGDTVLVTGASFSSVYNATQGALAAEFIRTNGDSGSGSPGIFQADDGSSSNRVALRLNSRLANAASQGTVVVGGAVITNTGSASSAIQGGVIRATMSYSAAGGNTNVAGGTPGPYTLTALPTACTQFAIGGGGGSLGATALSGHIRHIDYYRQVLPVDFITELSR